jgi:hypothetical protein
MEQNWLGKTKVILPDLILPSRVNQHWQYSGLDSIEHCLDKTHFKQYPHSVSYQYNSRGFRDQEWPDSVDELKKAIWCVGDSFTVGLGSPVEHTWPRLLQKQTGRRVINVSMDGASNNWIARRTALIQKEINPTNIVIMWSYLHRREHKDCNLDDEQRRIYTVASTNLENIDNFQDCVEIVKHNNVIQLAIPDYSPTSNFQNRWNTVRGPGWPLLAPTTVNQLVSLPDFVQNELKEHFKLWPKIQQFVELSGVMSSLNSNIIDVNRLDLARDSHHFDVVTAQWVVDQTVSMLIQPA